MTTITEERNHRLTLKITLSEPIDDLQVDEVAELTTDAMIAAGYAVESYAAHLGDPSAGRPWRGSEQGSNVGTPQLAGSRSTPSGRIARAADGRMTRMR